MRNKKGFTLIEVIAVIVILGVLMLLVVPAVSRYINESKKKTYIATVKNIVDTVRYGVNSGDSTYQVNTGESRDFYFKDIKTEKGIITKSPYGDFKDSFSYVRVTNNDGNYTYEVQAKDTGDYAIPLTNVNDLDTSKVKKYGELTEDEKRTLKEYNTYSIGDIIEYKESNWYVIKDSTSIEDYVTLLKETALTRTELGQYVYDDGYPIGDRYKKYYSTAKFDKTSPYSNDYATSNVKAAVEAYATSKGMMNDLKEVETEGVNYKIRLITTGELENNLGYKEQIQPYSEPCVRSTNLTPSWVYSGYGENNATGYYGIYYGYWTMDHHADSTTTAIANDGIIMDVSVTSISVGVRPVINLLKSVIE